MQWTILECDMRGRFHTLRRMFFKIILIDREPRDHNADPYNDNGNSPYLQDTKVSAWLYSFISER